MKKNVGGLDRFFRLGLGFLSLAILTAADDPVLRVLFGLTAILGLATGVLGYCPINDKLGLDTRTKKKE